MPRISEFYGIIIAMFYEDHEPAHFHVVYGEHRAAIGIAPLVLLRGDLPRRALSLVFEWASANQQQLIDNWYRTRQHVPLERIPPLD